MNKKILILFSVLALALGCSKGGGTPDEPGGGGGGGGATGVYTISGTISDSDANPIAGVVVSDGINCVKTDSQGKYYLPSNLSSTEYVFVSTPSGYSAPKEDGHAIFWKFLKDCNKGSNGKYDIPFTLNKIPNPERFTIFIFADPQPRSSSAGLDKIAYHSLDVCNDMYLDMKEYAATMTDRPVYGIGLGDIVHQATSLLPNYRAGMASTERITTYNVIGNHDQGHKQGITDKEAIKAYEAVMGPCNYSFNLGGMHFLMLDNMIGGLDNSATSYSDECVTGLSDDIWTFVQNDLKYVPVSTPLMVCAHSPMVQLQGGGLRSGAHLGDLRNLLSKYVKAYVWAGHTHTTFNYVDKSSPVIETHTLTRVAGQLWHNDYLGGNGTPRGYTVFEYSNGNVQWKFKPLYYQKAAWVGTTKPDYSLRDWDYDANGRAVLKSNGQNLDDSYQMQVLKPGTYSGENQNYIFVNVFLWDELWSRPVFTTSETQAIMQRVNPFYSLPDWQLASFYHNKVSDITAKTDNCSSMFRAFVDPESDVKTGTVSVRDRFGNTYSQTVSW